jgi:RNA polymerase sigma-70 factor (ECF subfamily)
MGPLLGGQSSAESSEEAAARELYPRVRLILAKRLGSDHPDFEDSVQEVMVGAMAASRRGAVRDPEKLAAYVHGIIRNVVAERLRRKYRDRSRDSAMSADTGLAGLGPPPANPIERLFAREALDHLADGIRRLGPKQRQVFHLLMVRGEDVKTVARTLDLDPARVREAKHYAVMNLRQHLKSCGIEAADVLTRVESRPENGVQEPS